MKKIYLIIAAIVLLVLCIGLYLLKNKRTTTYSEAKSDVILSLEDKITDDTIWCGTFNLIWNDLKNELAKQDIVFTPQIQDVINLNKGTFSIKDLNDSSYYKTYGHPTLELKKEIEKNIKEKFNEKSDILDEFDWNGNLEDYILYTMLKKVFTFPTPFDKLNNSDFKDVKNVKYFGINNESDSKLRKQVTVLYYSDNDYAVRLTTNENDEVILVKGNNDDNFLDVYKNTMNKADKYTNKTFTALDTLMVPNININIKKNFDQLVNKTFLFSTGDEYYISKAVQTIKFELDNKGGKIKSEAGMQVEKNSAYIGDREERHFNFNDTFIIFLKEKNKDLPYFAAKVSDIKKFQ